MDEADLRAWLTLRFVEGIGCAALWALAQAWGSPAAILSAPEEELRECGCSPAVARAIRTAPDPASRKRIDREVADILRRGLCILSCLDEAYPRGLKTIADPPPLLYISGQWRSGDECMVAIVGSRRSTPAGRAFTERLSEDLARAGWTIVSGLARGIDGAAHRGALAGGGRTIAVLGCGIDRTYPPEHAALRRDIEANGAVLTEFPLGAPPHSYHFPQRNRVISALAKGVVVTEATLESGSLITARLAADQGREVFAVPGSIREETSRGPHRLIRDGAKLVETAEDVIVELLPQLDAEARQRLGTRATPPGISASNGGTEVGEEEITVLNALAAEPSHIDRVVETSRLPTPSVAAALLSLELKGLVRQLPGQLYIRL